MTKYRVRLILGLAALIVPAILVGAILFKFSPSQLHLPSCSFRAQTGLYCPGCGATRAIRRLMQGDLLGALRYNSLLFILAPCVVYILAYDAYDLWRGVMVPRRGVRNVAVFCLCAIIAYFILRNLPFEWCDWLRPPQEVCL